MSCLFLFQDGVHSDSNDILEEDLTQKCMMAVLSPGENGWYDKVAPVFQIRVTSTCNCVTAEIGIQNQVARDNNKRLLQFACHTSCIVSILAPIPARFFQDPIAQSLYVS